MTGPAIDPTKINLDGLLDYLLRKESNASNSYGDCARLEADHQQQIGSNGDLLGRLSGALTGLEDSLVQNELPADDKLCDKERIRQFYRRKEDLFAKLMRAADFCDEAHATEAAAGNETEENERGNTLRSLLNDLERCEPAIAECSAIKPGKAK